jgi:hypothetical protein
VTTPTIEIKRRLDAEVEQIRGYHADLTEDAKRRMTAQAREKADAEYQEAVEAQVQQIKERVEKAEIAVFATPYPYAASDVEKAQIRAARRAAYDSVYGSLHSLDPGEACEEFERLLERAERTQDPELAAAVYHVATERGERGVADSFLEKRSTEKRRWEEYVEARTEAESLDRVFDRAIGWTG